MSPVACGTAAHPELDPEALSAINDVGNATLGYTGKGVKVAFLADGLQINVADFHRNRLYASGGSPAGSRVITSYQDFSGDGTAAATSGGEAFLDASSIAAQGNAIYDLDRYASAAHPLPRGCDVRIVGAAPGATVDALKIFGSASDTTGSGFIQAINYAVTHGVNVINESFGSNGFPDEATDIVKAADDAAVAAGVTVVASSGDAGVNSTIGSPASDPAVIGVGASTTFRAYQQDYFGGINLPGQHDRYLDDNISALSSGGVAQDGKTVDLVAPGDLNWALCSASPAYQDCAGLPFQLTGGTSESSPLTAGAAADVIEAYRASHHGTTPSPAVVKEILTSTASDVHAPADQQGAGLLDVGAAVRLALSMPGTTRASAPGGLLVSAGQLDLSGQPSAAVMSTVSLTNTSTSAVHVTATTRGLEPFRVAKGHVTLDPSVRSRQPKLVIWSGAREVYQTAALRVLPGTSRVQLEAGYLYTNQTSLLHVALFTPAGQLAGYSNPQGIGDYADVEVADPAPGVWTAAFFTVWDGDAAGETGTTGPVPYTFTSSRWRGVGSAAPSVLSIGPGATRSITFRSTLPSTAGDSASSIVLRTQPAHVAKGTTPVVTETSVAVVERTMVPVGVSGGDFHGVLTGGNGR
ncbi:MAG TPA: S8 family serine peptidase, partial [Acidimicrobiales bacterium]|nr:S8 family serine peptidase [Acidimicrobiales bacterium]